MTKSRTLLILAPAAALLAAGCGGEMTTREKGTFGGAALGAATGAIIGSAVGHPGAGAAIGAGVGALGGTAVGGAIQESERRAEATPRQAPPAYPPTYGAPAPPPASQARGMPSGDPTRGQLENATRWKVQLYVDQDPSVLSSAPFLSLNPGEVVPQNLDIGAHRIIAQAFVDTQFGPRPVGRLDRSIQVDPRGSGWSLRFNEGDFK